MKIITFREIYNSAKEIIDKHNPKAKRSSLSNRDCKIINAILENEGNKNNYSIEIKHGDTFSFSGDARTVYAEYISSLCEAENSYALLKEKGWFYKSSDIDKKSWYKKIGDLEDYVYVNCNTDFFIVRIIKAIIDIKQLSYLDNYALCINFDENSEVDEKKTSQEESKTVQEKEMSAEEILRGIHNYMNSEGFIYDLDLIRNFYLSLKAKPFVILAGTSGTGKTKIVELFAEAIGATAKNGRYLLVPVRPDWSDSTDLLGHMNLNGEFVPGAITDFIFKANENPNKSYFICLDEMNLARVEYYLSDILSKIETRKVRENGRISSLPLFDQNAFSNKTKIVGTNLLAKEKYGNICLSENLYIIGTVNMDETTFPFSKKVLDRANTIEFSKVDSLVPDFDKISEAKQECIGALTDVTNDFLRAKYTKIEECSEMKDIVKNDCEILQTMNLILEEAEAHVGFRVRDEIVFYLLYSREIDGEDKVDAAFDNEIMQKILPRIQGSGMEILSLIEKLIEFCGNKYPKSKAKLTAMKERCGEYGEGYTSYWL